MNDPALAQELNTTWSQIFKKRLESGDIEVVRDAGEELAQIAEKLDSSNTRWKIATLVAFILGITVTSISLKLSDKAPENEPTQESAGSHEGSTTLDERLEHTINYYIEQRKKEWAVDPVEEQLKKLREIQWPPSPQESPYKNLNQLFTPGAQPNHPNEK